MTPGITQAVADAEDGDWPHPELRVGVFTFEIPDGTWGGAGRVIPLADIYELVCPLWPEMEGEPRQAAEQVLAARRRDDAERILSAAGEGARA